MLYAYPLSATTNNWLHVALVAVLGEVQRAVDEDRDLPNWPEIVPPGYRSRLEGRTSLRDAVLRYHRALATASEPERELVHRIVHGHDALRSLLGGESDCPTLAGCDDALAEPLKQLGFAFYKLLQPLEIRRCFYTEIYNALPRAKLCPFCGTMELKSPKARVSQVLDHFLPRALYPVFSASLENLVPMCGDCNREKLDKDILRVGPGGARSSVHFPYDPIAVRLDLGGVGFFAAHPTWTVGLRQPGLDLETWNAIFDVCRRWNELLSQRYKEWLGNMAVTIVHTRGSVEGVPLADILYDYLELVRKEHESNGRDHLRLAFFEWLDVLVARGDERMGEFLWGIIREESERGPRTAQLHCSSRGR
ncbi:hypothetical protein ENSA5_62830 [Enhygromyxa salina]|uniref:HNH endonuclease n=1 Tax=Enhygromyxa salina TaxID=215803 RepID=A0A2S9XCS7_9BACT|nr:HNH endonuclease [Enhygromyxa salina]PRP90664.1 hypothetical protein ENSA5_62830 [Enhygromyxa salina]